MKNMKKLIAYVFAFIYFKVGLFLFYILNNLIWDDYLYGIYFYLMNKADEWQNWGGINYPWKEDKNK
jgi:hypothetical protein